MIDIKKAEQEAVSWGISLVDYMELNVRVHGTVDVFGDSTLNDGPEENWREVVAEVLVENGLVPKGNRFLQCSKFAHLYKCEGPAPHKLFSPIYCDLRFCPRCGPRQFARLIKKYEPIVRAVSAERTPGFRLREITLTSANLGSLTAHQITVFNKAVKDTLKRLMRQVKGWGAIWCDEVGFKNTNLHAHILFWGPYVAQPRLAEVWHELSGHQVVWIRKAAGNGAAALLYLLKYVSKPPSDDPRELGLLEVAFHKTRRIHTTGLFFNFAGEDADHEHSEWTSCPHCGADIVKEMGNPRIEKAILEGRTFVGTKHTSRRKEWVN